MNEWVIELHDVDKDEWMTFTRGSLEDVLGDLFTFRGGHYGPAYDQARILSPVRTP